MPERSVQDLIRDEATRQGVPPELALAVAEQESSFNPTAMGPPIPHLGGTRAIGTFQLLPETARTLTVNPHDPAQNIRGGVNYLRQLLDRHEGDMDQVLRTYGGVVKDTKYVPGVLERMPKFRTNVAGTPAVEAPPAPPRLFDTERKYLVDPLLKFGDEATKSLQNLPSGIAQMFHAGPHGVAAGLWEGSAQPFREGDYLKAIPLVGHRLGEAREFAEEGEYARALGAATDVGAQIFGPKAIRSAGRAIPLTPRLFLPRLLPEQQAAVEWGLQHPDLPIDVATASGSRVARSLQQGAESTLAGGPFHEAARLQRQTELPRLGGQLAERVHPLPVTPGEAGVGLRTAAGDYMAGRQTAASAAYDFVEQVANDPVHLQRVQTGSRPAWNNPANQIPIFEMVQAPVDLSRVQASAAPVLAEIEATMPLGQQQFSQGLQALRNLMALRRFEPVTVVERNLGAIKRVARGAEHPALRNLEQGTAAHAITELSNAVDQTMARLGPQAQQALAEGRAATRAKWATEDLFDQVNKEPVAGFRAVTGTGDLHAEALAQVAQVAPQEIPRIGRAVLQNIFEKAQGLEQGWSKHTTVANAWETLGPQTKQILFGGNINELNHFFVLQKMLAEQANPSRTMLVGSTLGSTLVGITNPLWGVLTQVGAGGFAALMNSRAGIRLLTEGLTIQPGTAQAAAWTALVLRAAGEQAAEGNELLSAGPPPPPPAAAPPPDSQVATPPPQAPPRRRYLGGSRWAVEAPPGPRER